MAGTLEAGGPSDMDAIGANGGLVAIHLWGAKDGEAIFCQDQNGKEDPICGIPAGIWNVNKMSEIYPAKPCVQNTEYPAGDCFYQYDDPAKQHPIISGARPWRYPTGGTLRLFGKKGLNLRWPYARPCEHRERAGERLITNLKTTDTQFDVDGQESTGGKGRRRYCDHAYRLSARPCRRGDHLQAPLPHRRQPRRSPSAPRPHNGKEEQGGVRFPHAEKTYKIPADGAKPT